MQVYTKRYIESDKDEYDTEIEAYKHLIKNKVKVVPKFVLAKKDTNRGDFVIKIERLVGYKTLCICFKGKIPRHVFIEIVKSLRDFHITGIAHGDLHDDNIMLRHNSIKDVWIAKIIDFGLSTISYKEVLEELSDGGCSPWEEWVISRLRPDVKKDYDNFAHEAQKTILAYSSKDTEESLRVRVQEYYTKLIEALS